MPFSLCSCFSSRSNTTSDDNLPSARYTRIIDLSEKHIEIERLSSSIHRSSTTGSIRRSREIPTSSNNQPRLDPYGNILDEKNPLDFISDTTSTNHSRTSSTVSLPSNGISESTATTDTPPPPYSPSTSPLPQFSSPCPSPPPPSMAPAEPLTSENPANALHHTTPLYRRNVSYDMINVGSGLVSAGAGLLGAATGAVALNMARNQDRGARRGEVDLEMGLQRSSSPVADVQVQRQVVRPPRQQRGQRMDEERTDRRGEGQDVHDEEEVVWTAMR